ncbi:MAG: DUF72 domain-containing protein [Nitrospinota bacterium]
MAGWNPFLGRENYEDFKQGLALRIEAGKFGFLLFQFPPAFKADAPSQEKLENLLARFRKYPPAVEFRPRPWSNRRAEARDVLDALGFAWAFIDEPNS